MIPSRGFWLTLLAVITVATAIACARGEYAAASLAVLTAAWFAMEARRA